MSMAPAVADARRHSRIDASNCVLGARSIRESRSVFSHIMVGANDMPKAQAFYDAIFATLNVDPAKVDARGRLFYRLSNGTFAVTTPIDGAPAQRANGGTIGFVGASPERVRAWHDAGVANGGQSIEDPPGIRDNPMGKFFTAYLRDPDGNKLCMTHRMAQGA